MTELRVGWKEFSGKLATEPKLATSPREFPAKLATKCETGNSELIPVASLGALLPVWALSNKLLSQTRVTRE